MKKIIIQSQDFSVSEEYGLLRQSSKGMGAVVTFIGLVRDFEGDSKLKHLTIQHYPEMTERLIKQTVDESYERWTLNCVSVIHRVGKLTPSDQILFVGVSGRHRADAFCANQFIMDYLKTKATLWKKVHYTHRSEWVKEKISDTVAAERWRFSNE